MTKLNPYYMVKQAKRTEIFANGGYYTVPNDDGSYEMKRPLVFAMDYYNTKELPFFNKYWMPMPGNHHLHLTEFGLPLLGGLIGAYTGKGFLNKLKNGLIGALIGTGIHGIADYSGLRSKLFNNLIDRDKPIAYPWQKEVTYDKPRYPTESEYNTYWSHNPDYPESFILNIND